MFDDYKKSVILAYQKKMDEGPISINLSVPTPAKLRKECLIVYSERRLQKDEEILRSFFGSKDDLDDYTQRIRNFDIDKFRPLISLLKGRIAYTDEKNVQLLAWLINFEPRPFISGNSYKNKFEVESAPEGSDISSKKENEDNIPSIIPNDNEEEIDTYTLENESSDAEAVDTETKNTESDPSNEGNKDAEETEIITYEVPPIIVGVNRWKELLLKLKIRKAIVSFITIIVAGGVSYYIITKKECMYWTGDQYQCIACNQKLGDTSIIALDTIKVAHLKKITRPDTLTENSVGKAWYTKIDNKVEFFTSSGFHPLYTDRRLRPVTMYMLNKYIIQNKQPVVMNKDKN